MVIKMRIFDIFRNPATGGISHSKLWANVACAAGTFKFVMLPDPSAEIWAVYLGIVGGYTPTENLYGEIGVTGTGKRYGYDSRNKEVTTLPGFARVDAMLGWNHKNVNVTFAAANLLNQKYWRSDAMPGNPRGYTARVNYRF